MTWPNTTKASTLNVDNGADKPSLARADIKQNIDNVNSIIDTFDIASPTNGDILAYNSTSGAWEPGASSGGGNSETAFCRIIDSQGESVTSSIYRRYVALYEDVSWITQTGTTSGGITVRGGNSSSYAQMTLDAGTYIFQIITGFDKCSDGEVPTNIYNESDTSNIIKLGGYGEIGSTNTGFYTGVARFTLAASKTISLRADALSLSNRESFWDFNIYKTA